MNFHKMILAALALVVLSQTADARLFERFRTRREAKTSTATLTLPTGTPAADQCTLDADGNLVCLQNTPLARPLSPPVAPCTSVAIATANFEKAKGALATAIAAEKDKAAVDVITLRAEQELAMRVHKKELDAMLAAHEAEMKKLLAAHAIAKTVAGIAQPEAPVADPPSE